MNYQKAVAYLEGLGAFHKAGASAYHPGLQNIKALDEWLGAPSKELKCIHVAGTNGKGSSSALLAAVLSVAGYRTGLYSSPHLVDMCERIRIDGLPVPRDFVVEFASRLADPSCPVRPSYFEALTAMAFEWFRRSRVDVAIVEVGLGGRLDSTNIISPLLSVITNISLDHTAILGDSLEAIAAEKAGIIKPDVPLVVGHAQQSVRRVFLEAAAAFGPDRPPVIFAEDNPLYAKVEERHEQCLYRGTPWGDVACPLTGSFQHENAATVFNALVQLSTRFDITPQAVKTGFAHVATLSGLTARWMPCTFRGAKFIADTGHNPGAWEHLGPRLERIAAERPLFMVVGFLADKDLEAIVNYMPRAASYRFVTPAGDRARAADDTAAVFAAHGIEGRVCADVDSAIADAAREAAPEGVVFVGGSNFVVSSFLKVLSVENAKSD